MINPEKTNYYIYTGSEDWENQQGLLGLYPEDLPSDWRLAFYNTQFRCVYLPLEKWIHASDGELFSWLNDTNEKFRFVLEAPKQQTTEYSQLAERFGARGVLETDIDLRWLDANPDLRQLASIMQTAINTGKPVYLISREGNLTLLRQVNELMEVLGV